MPLEKATEILRQEVNNGKLDQTVVNYLIELVGDVRKLDKTQDYN
jgi:HD-GYP domain-containing protein (c-di-GMP phosphodiesterase class II)